MTAELGAWPGRARFGPTTDVRTLRRSCASAPKRDYLSIARPRAESLVLCEQDLVDRRESCHADPQFLRLPPEIAQAHFQFREFLPANGAALTTITPLLRPNLVGHRRIVVVDERR